MMVLPLVERHELDLRHMQKALDSAEIALSQGEIPIGAHLVDPVGQVCFYTCKLC